MVDEEERQARPQAKAQAKAQAKPQAKVQAKAQAKAQESKPLLAPSIGRDLLVRLASFLPSPSPRTLRLVLFRQYPLGITAKFLSEYYNLPG